MTRSALPPATAAEDAAAMLRGLLAALADGQLTPAVQALGARDARPRTFDMPDGRRVNVAPDPGRAGGKALLAAAGRSPSAFAPAFHAFAVCAAASTPGFLVPTTAAVAKLARMSEPELFALAGDGPVPDLEEMQMRLERMTGP